MHIADNPKHQIRFGRAQAQTFATAHSHHRRRATKKSSSAYLNHFQSFALLESVFDFNRI
jgi:hypothetical protein